MIPVTVSFALRDAVGEGFARVPKTVRDAIGVRDGDSIEVVGPLGSVRLTAVIAQLSEVGQMVVGLDRASRDAIGVPLGGLAQVRRPGSRSRRRRAQTLFSYGSNHPGQLERRLGRVVSDARAAYLEDYVLRFMGKSITWGGGVAGIVPKEGGEVCGFVCSVTNNDLAILDVSEGVANDCYRRTTNTVMVEQPDGSFAPVEAVVYVPGSRRLSGPHRKPTPAYVRAVKKTIFGHWPRDGECSDYLKEALRLAGSSPV